MEFAKSRLIVLIAMCRRGQTIKTTWRNPVRKLRGFYFWQRALVLLASGFVFAVSVRLGANWLIALLFLIQFPIAVWLLASIFGSKKRQASDRKPEKKWWIKAIAAISLVPVAWISTVALGVTLGVAIKPYTKAELAEQKARAELEARMEKVRAKAEADKKIAEAEAARDKAAAKAAAELDERRKAAAQAAAAKALAEAKATKEAEAAAEKAATDASAAASKAARDRAIADKKAKAEKQEAELKRINDLKGPTPLLYAAESCALELQSLKIDSYKYVSTSEDGTSLFLSTTDAYDISGLLVFNCVKEKLEFSRALVSSIESTNALAGTKTWDENRMQLQWSYHPRTGLNLAIQREKQCFLFFCN